MLSGRCAGCSQRQGALVGVRTLPELRADGELEDLVVLRKGNRLSITPVEPQHWRVICKLLGNPAL